MREINLMCHPVVTVRYGWRSYECLCKEVNLTMVLHELFHSVQRSNHIVSSARSATAASWKERATLSVGNRRLYLRLVIDTISTTIPQLIVGEKLSEYSTITDCAFVMYRSATYEILSIDIVI